MAKRRRTQPAPAAAAARRSPSRVSATRILDELRLAGRKGDRAALALAVDEMRTLALSPRYWARYLAVLRNPLARLVDLLVIKQGDRIAHQKGWKLPKPASDHRAAGRPSSRRATPPRRRPAATVEQPTLFDV
jgi:hypothetical protein